MATDSQSSILWCSTIIRLVMLSAVQA
jgi:hypothetical protein